MNIPKEGPFIYEFDIEVRPEFDLPDYKGLKLRRPIHTFTDDEVRSREEAAARTLRPARAEGRRRSRRLGDIIIADVTITFDGKETQQARRRCAVKVEKQLALSDGVAEDFGEQDGRAPRPATCATWTSRCRRKSAAERCAARRCRRRSRSRTSRRSACRN